MPTERDEDKDDDLRHNVPDEGEAGVNQVRQDASARGARSDGKKKDTEPRRETRKRIRKIVERHRETFDDLAK